MQLNGSGSIIVLAENPFNVMATEDSAILGYGKNELIGHSVITKICGPKTDIPLLQLAIMKAVNHQESKGQYVLYDRHSNHHHSMVSFAPFYHEDILVGCRVVLHPSQAITLQQAFEVIQESNGPNCLVAIDVPHIVLMVNKEFTARFASGNQLILGHDLFSVVLSNSHDDLQRWAMLFAAVREGRVVKGTVVICSATGDGTVADEAMCVPVVEAANGSIRHFLIFFPPTVAASASACQCPVPHNTRQPVPNRPAQDDRAASTASTPRRSAPAAGPAIQPRRKPGTEAAAGGRQPGPVVITSAVISTLRDLPLQEAAQTLGISATAFKRACRKLGLKRWAYKRRHFGRPGWRTLPPAGSAAAAAEAADAEAANGSGRSSPSASARGMSMSPSLFRDSESPCRLGRASPASESGASDSYPPDPAGALTPWSGGDGMPAPDADLWSACGCWAASARSCPAAVSGSAEAAARARGPCGLQDEEDCRVAGWSMWGGAGATNLKLDDIFSEIPAPVDDSLVLEMLAQAWPTRLPV